MTREEQNQSLAAQMVNIELLQRYRNLVDNIPHIILRLNASGDLDCHNARWTQYTGMSTSESRGFDWKQIVYREDAALVAQSFQAAMATGRAYQLECRLCRYDGIYRWHRIKLNPEFDRSGILTSWLGTLTDIEEHKVLEAKLTEAQRQAESAHDIKARFLANMSHEIRTPLNAILGFTELLLDPSHSPEEKMKSASIVRRNCNSLLKIVNELFDIHKVESGQMVTEKVETSIEDLLNEIRMLLKVQARKKKVNLVFEQLSSLPERVLADATRLRQILANVIGNALKFTEEGQVRVSTRYQLSHPNKAYFNFLIEDTGMGIDKKSAERIFLPFTQADASNTRNFGGIGLGLALARQLARAMGGDVQLIKSSPGEGSTFLISVEVDVPVSQDIPDFKAESGQSQTESSPLNGKRILLVEDAEDNQLLIRQFLSRTGAIIDFAGDGEEGVRKALSKDYAVVLMDIQMPIMDGYEATAKLRQSGFRRPIIALTAHALAEEIEKSLRSGCTSHLTKPIDRRQLIDRLIQIIA